MDYMNAFPETRHVYDELDTDTQLVVSMFNEVFRTNINNTNNK